MVGGDDLEVTNILDPDLGQKDLKVTKQDIDLGLDDALLDVPLEEGEAAGEEDLLDLDDLLDEGDAGQYISPLEERTMVIDTRALEAQAQSLEKEAEHEYGY
ncbi:MAG: hypothetical protein AB1896_15795, partial [Thermodesulfobacteriota bacterium]